MKKCISCGAALNDIDKFCGECGTKQPEAKKFCIKCGAELKPTAKFCIKCGNPVAQVSAVASANHTVSNQANASVSDPTILSNNDVEVTRPDENTIALVIQGIPFKVKLVMGRDYESPEEICDFYMSDTPITQALWMVLTGTNPSTDNSDLNFPVTNIDATMITSFFIKLQYITGVKFELPSLRQWEHARNGAHKTEGYRYSGSNKLTDVGWNDGKIHPVGELFANELGLFDLDGNVEELLKDGKQSKLTPDYEEPQNIADLTGLRIVFNIPKNIQSDNFFPRFIKENQDYIEQQRKEVEQYWEAKRQEEERIRTEKEAKEEAAKKAAEEEAKRKAAEAEKKKTKRLNDLKKKFRGILRYSGNDETFRGYKELYEADIEKDNDTRKEVLKIINKSIVSGEIEWKKYFKTYFENTDLFGYPEGNFHEENILYGVVPFDSHWKILVLKGKGEMPNCPHYKNIHNKNAWAVVESVNDYNFKSVIKYIVILEGITGIGARNFCEFKELEQLILPNSLQSVGFISFLGAKSLKTLLLPQKLEIIKNGAFYSSGLEHVLIPQSVKRIEKEAFYRCDNMQCLVASESTIIE